MRTSPRLTQTRPGPPPPDEGEDDGRKLKRAFAWGGGAAVIGGVSALATSLAYGSGSALAVPLRVGLTLAGGLGGAIYLSRFFSAEAPKDKLMGALAGGGAMALVTTMGAGAGLAGGGIATVAAVQASVAVGVVYGGFGALVLGEPKE